jgi:proline iminopeptidase
MASIPSAAESTEIAGVNIPSATSRAVPSIRKMMKKYFEPLVAFLTLLGRSAKSERMPPSPLLSARRTNAKYFNDTTTGVKSGGVKMIPITTPVGTFKVWTKKFGNNPRIKILLLHGGPACTHEYMECFESFFPKEGFEFYEYDQLGSYYSDQPTDSSLWTLDRFVEEVEQVRKTIHADKNNFYILGNSWGGMLAMQYALKYQSNMKGMIVANMMASCSDYGKYHHYKKIL